MKLATLLLNHNQTSLISIHWSSSFLLKPPSTSSSARGSVSYQKIVAWSYLGRTCAILLTIFWGFGFQTSHDTVTLIWIFSSLPGSFKKCGDRKWLVLLEGSSQDRIESKSVLLLDLKVILGYKFLLVWLEINIHSFLTMCQELC